MDSFQLTDWTHGAISSDINDPLSDVSIANSSLSIDMLKGCALQCAYCHVQGTFRNLDDTGGMPKRVKNISQHMPVDVLRALVKHSSYTPTSVISIGTSSTEPFASEAIGDTINLMQGCLDLNLPNPIWIVTKAGIPKKALEYIRHNSNKQNIIISPTWGGANKLIEPAQNDRFAGGKEAIECGAKILLYLRPIVEEWGGDKEKITYILSEAKNKIGNNISVIAPGGLRWTEGVEYGLSRRGIPWPSSIPKIDNEKELSEDMWLHIFSECGRIFPGIPVVRNSSCGLSHILSRPDIGAKHYVKPEVCESSECSGIQRKMCARQRELLSNSQSYPVLMKKIFATTGLEGLPPTHEPKNVGQWLSILPYDQKTTVIKILADHEV